MRKAAVVAGVVVALILALVAPARRSDAWGLEPGGGVRRLRGVLRGRCRARAVVGLPVGHADDPCRRGVHATATGAGVSVGVIDGGVDFTHPDLAGSHRRGSVVLVHLQRHADGRPAGDRQRRLLEQGRGAGSAGPRHARRHDHRRTRSTASASPASRRTPPIVAIKACTIAGFLLRRLGRRRSPLRRRSAARRRQPQPVRRSVPLLLQERRGAAGDPAGTCRTPRATPSSGASSSWPPPATRPRTSGTRRSTTSARTGRRTPPWSARYATTAASRRPSSPASSRCPPPA